MKKNVFIISTILVSGFIFSFVFKNYLFESFINYQLTKKGLHPKSYTFKKAKLSFLPLQITITKPRYEFGIKGNAYWTFDSDSLQILVNYNSLWSDELQIENLSIEGLNVVLSEVLPIIKNKSKDKTYQNILLI